MARVVSATRDVLSDVIISVALEKICLDSTLVAIKRLIKDYKIIINN